MKEKEGGKKKRGEKRGCVRFFITALKAEGRGANAGNVMS